jgi:hypothetical protein
MVIIVMIIIFGKIGRFHKARQQHMVFSQKLSDSGGQMGCQHITYNHAAFVAVNLSSLNFFASNLTYSLIYRLYLNAFIVHKLLLQLC